MWKAVVASAFVLLISAGARGDLISQDQGMDIGTTNIINLMHGDQSADSSQNMLVNITQNSTGGNLTIGSITLNGSGGLLGNVSATSSMLSIGQAMMASGLVSAWGMHSLSDQARLYALMSGN